MKFKKCDVTVLVILSLVIATIFALSYYFFHKTKPVDPVPTTKVTEKAVVITNPLTGEENYPLSAVGKRPVAISINNISFARPQWGLCSPDIVMEGLAEGGITRMLWLYANSADIPKVGSIRSARHDFVEMAEGFDSIFVHWGGSIYAYDAISRRSVNDIDAKIYDTYFDRDNARDVDIEHRGYTTGQNIVKAISDIKYRTTINTNFEKPFIFGKTAHTNGDCKSISFAYSDSAAYKFSFAQNRYYCYINGEKMTEDGGRQFAVDNVFLLYCTVKSLGDNAGCIDMDLTQGVGVYVSHGKYTKLKWKKGLPNEMLKFYDETGKQLVLNKGKSYIGFVPTTMISSTVLS